MFTEGEPGSIGYVLMGFPRVSETFIASELHRVERAGVSVRLFVLKPVEERERGLRHPVVDAIAAEPQYLPDTASLTAPLHRWRPRHLKPFVPALRRTLRRRPRGVARARRHAPAARRSATAARRCRARARSTSRSSLQAIALADRAARRSPTSATCTPTSRTGPRPSPGTRRRSPACRSRSPATRATSTRPSSTPRAGCAASCSPRASRSPAPRRTCEHLKRIAPEAEVHLVYHGLNADFARLVREHGARRRAERQPARARRRPPGGQEGLRRASSTRAPSCDAATSRSRR